MKNPRSWFYRVLFLLILIVAAYFRFVGLNWDQSQHLHPDERFMTMVESALDPVHSLSDYFNTDTSSLNPHNRGYTFYVYGDLPVTIVRYAADWMSGLSAWAVKTAQLVGSDGSLGSLLVRMGKTTNWAGYDEVTLVGRALSAFSDLGSIVLLYLISKRLYGQKVAVLAAAFSALAVMQIQQAHFFTVDMFANFFMFLAIYFAVEVMTGNSNGNFSFGNSAILPSSTEESSAGSTFRASQVMDILSSAVRNPLVWNVIGFGMALGASVASKINAAPLAALLPLALVVRYFKQRTELKRQFDADQAEITPASDGAETTDAVEDLAVAQPGEKPDSPRLQVISLETIFVLLVLGGLVSALAFRVFMPYAFSGPGFLGMSPNPKWVANITEQRAQASGDVDFPPALQWARRSFWYSGYNLVAWGLGWPLGILAMLGFLYMGYCILRGEWKEHLLLWGWTGAYFLWQSTQWNPTMRYQLPIYPLLAMLAAWLIFNGPRFFTHQKNNLSVPEGDRVKPVVANTIYLVVGALVLIATVGWAYAFTRIYTRDHSRVQATRWLYQNVPGPYNLKITRADGSVYTQPMSLPIGGSGIGPGFLLSSAAPYEVQIQAFESGVLKEITIANAANVGMISPAKLNVSIADAPGLQAADALGTASMSSDFAVQKSDYRGESYRLQLDRPVQVVKDNLYFLTFTTDGTLSLVGSAPVHETSWDDGLPLRMDGYDAYGGIYQGDLNFEMYWDDNAEKLNRFETNLNSADYVFITSNRQWATTTRIPERYPLTTTYYRNLLGCPADKDVIWCYNVATPGMFAGNLGFELIQTFTSYPELFGYQFNTQFADEAFTVYDAPKVLIFKKTDTYDARAVSNLLRSVDLTRVVHVTPRQAGRLPGDLTLPPDRLASNRAGGTWSELFSYETLQNKYPLLGLVIWYLAIGLLGIFTWPLLRFLLPGLADKGYPLARLSGLLLLAYLVWLFASLGGQFTRPVIAIVYLLILVAGGVSYYIQRADIAKELRSKGKYFLIIEGVFLLLFLIDLGIRLGNPDLWHPSRGGERPMDFSYLNAVIKSTTFPPYDPWYAGGYINYYYWGFVLVGTPIKLLGIVPSIAYNFVLPTLFALLGIGGFSVVWNIISSLGDDKDEETAQEIKISWQNRPLIAGLTAAMGLVLIGNLGTVQLIFHALQKMTVTNEMVDAQGVFIPQRWLWALQGLVKLFSGSTLPIGWGEYYWAPSRVMPLGDLAITEFPLFTFLYSDLHAHMLALPITVLVIAWTVSMLLMRRKSLLTWLGTIMFGGLVIGALRPTNTWDFPTYLALGVIVTGYTIFRYFDIHSPAEGQPGSRVEDMAIRLGLPLVVLRLFLALVGMGLLVGFALLFFQPFAHWYGLAYSSVSQWSNEKTPIWSYWTQWGLFLFVIIAWMTWETRQWLAQTPLSALTKLKPYELLIEVVAAGIAGMLLALQFVLKVPVAWFAFPLAVWALLLMLRPSQPDGKRLVLFMIGTGLVLTLIVEFIVLSGDIGRMNTVFKFYLQVWVLFAISAAAALGWIMKEFSQWGQRGKWIFQLGGGVLLAGALMFTYTGIMDKIRDRIAANIPFTFDTITYMQYSTYWDQVELDLSRDYHAIRWMQDNIQGSPVIVEANTPEYRWGTRYTIYTGLPGVVGWNWHQRQQRALFPDGWVSGRVQEITDFYNTRDLSAAKKFINKYDVKYIVVGQLEQNLYRPEGLAKFEFGVGSAWKVAYEDSGTVIYEVLP